jgi:FkbM family methyltransferase
VDCGAYTGDTIQSFIAETGNVYRKVHAFEADPAVLPELRTFITEVGSHAVLHTAAVGAHNGKVRFAGDGMGGGCLTDGSGTEVNCVRLDDALVHEKVSFIKMDIEGAELQALEGAHRLIWRHRPVLAVCAYHTPDHLWRVPLSLKSLAPDSLLFLRSHCADGLDTVCYSVPPERRIQTVTGQLEPEAQIRSRRAESCAV